MIESQGNLKQDIIRLYNQINQEMFNIGTKWVKIEIFGRYILILAKHRRIPSSTLLDKKAPILSRMIDVILLDEFKDKLKFEFSNKFEFEIDYILKDYDPINEMAGTLIVLRNSLINE